MTIAAGHKLLPLTGNDKRLFDEHYHAIALRCDRMFALLFVVQWLAGIVVALAISPYAWDGLSRHIHPHVWAAALVGGAILSFPIVLISTRPGAVLTRHVIAVSQMLWSALLIHLSGGRIETHFHIFGSLAFLAFYRDWRVLITATIVVATDHMARGLFWPESVFGIAAASDWRWVEHAGWVAFEDVFLVFSCIQGQREMREIAVRQAHMEDANAAIDRQVQVRTAELNASQKDLKIAKDAAEAASRAKSEFLAKMSHEIRTPLNGLTGMVELMSRTTLDEQQNRYLQVARSSADALLSVINDILDFSKIEAGQMELEMVGFDLHKTIDEIIDAFATVATRKSIELGCTTQTDVPQRVIGDACRFRQVLSNLISNALKFTEKGRVLVRIARVDDPTASPTHRLEQPVFNGLPIFIRVDVDDTGIGVSPANMDRLFKSFSQADASTTRKFGGTGLGLAICKRLVELMGGQIGVTSEVGRGTTFSFVVKFQPEIQCLDNRRDNIAPDRLSNLSVLVVDDNPAALEILVAGLTQWNWRVATAVDAPSGLEAMRSAANAGKPFDVALLDIRMPGMDGWQMAAAIKADRLIRNIPLIAVSAMEERMEKPRLAAAGFAAGLTKPLKQSRLFDAIASAILASDPGSEPSAKTDLPTPAIDSTPKGIRILVAEDNEVNQYVARKLLASNGYECDIVCNGRLAVSAAARRHYNLILMDCAMPEMDGFEATLHIRAAEVSAGGSRHVPIIALTAEAVRGDREKCRDAGMDEYVSKPINPDDLFSKIRLLTANPPQTADRVDASGLTAAPAVKPPSPIDVPALLARSMNDAGFATETLVRFKAQVAKDLDLLQKSVAARAIPDAARLAHSLKGIAGHIGAASLRDTAARIESLGNAADVAQIESTLAELKTEIDRCVESIPDAVRQLGATSNA